jgi:hypothetical protein
MRSSYRLLCPHRSRLMPVAAAAPIALLAGRPVAALGPVSGGTALAVAGGLAVADGPAAAPPGLPPSQLHVNGVRFAITLS